MWVLRIELNVGPLKEQSVLFTVEPSLQPPFNVIFVYVYDVIYVLNIYAFEYFIHVYNVFLALRCPFLFYKFFLYPTEPSSCWLCMCMGM